jgi:hypothetical protein
LATSPLRNRPRSTSSKRSSRPRAHLSTSAWTTRRCSGAYALPCFPFRRRRVARAPWAQLCLERAIRWMCRRRNAGRIYPPRARQEGGAGHTSVVRCRRCPSGAIAAVHHIVPLAPAACAAVGRARAWRAGDDVADLHSGALDSYFTRPRAHMAGAPPTSYMYTIHVFTSRVGASILHRPHFPFPFSYGSWTHMINSRTHSGSSARASLTFQRRRRCCSRMSSGEKTLAWTRSLRASPSASSSGALLTCRGRT